MIIQEYHRPDTLEEALALLNRAQIQTAAMGGGTLINGLPETVPEAVVDLQSLPLAGISRDGDLVRMGATTTLQELVDDRDLPELVRDLAHAEAPNTIRNAATVGGTVAAADWESRLLAGLLAMGATVAIAGPAGEQTMTVEQVLSDLSVLAGGIITSVSIPSEGHGASSGTARTPADTPIVFVAGYRSEPGETRFAATGVGSTPQVVDLDRIEPPQDFRGSAQYRRHLVETLISRVEAQLGVSA